MQIFQKNILRKYTESLNPDRIEKSYRQFADYFLNPERQENIRNSKEEQFQEGFLRELFVNILGYTLNPDPDFNLITEKKNETNSKKADGAILADGEVVGVIELKDHKTTDLGKVEAQAFNYKSQHKDAVYVVISNFEKLRFYIDNAVDFEEFDLFRLTKDDFARLWICLAYESIVKNLPKQIKEASLNNEEQITNALYKDYSSFKRELFEDILKNNPTDDTEHKILLFKKTQKLLDRLLFIFFAEDRDLLPPNSIMLIIEQWEKLKDLDEYQPFYNRLKKYFGYMNTGFQGKNFEVFAYNDGLFKPDEILDGLIITDELLVKYCKKLSDYDFASDVDVNILGHIFENSLTEIEEITTKLQQGEAPTISKRKKDGVFYTPQYITKYIVENTVGKLCKEKKEELGIDENEYFADKKRQLSTKKTLIQKLDAYRDWLLQISICDPACGSGAFLNAALDFLMAEHKLIDEMQAKVAGESIVFQNVENSILENNLYGVDINEESVEIAKLSLWLRTAKPHRKLSSLNNNIKCGNSLIDDTKIAGEKAFCWEKEFPTVFREKKKLPWHITTAVHDSRTSDRMIEYKVRQLRDHGTRPYPEPMLLSEQEEIIITETVAKIVAEDKLNVLAYNICFDHMHLLLVCEEEEVPRIVGKIKSMTARAVNIAMGRTIPMAETETATARTAVATTGHDPLSVPAAENLPDETAVSDTVPEKRPKKGRTQCSLWTQKFGCTPIRSQEHLYNAIAYIKTNREHHNLSPLDVEYPHCVSIDEGFRPEYSGGFDVVIGNPPYVQLQTMGEMSKKYEECGYEVFSKTSDLYCLFYERGCRLLKRKGLLGFIASNKWLKVNYGIPLRRYLTSMVNPYILIDFPGVPVFEDATVDPQILLLSKEPYSGNTYACACKDTSDIELFFEENKKTASFGEDAWAIPDDSSAVFDKINNGKALKDLPITINYGIKTGYNDAFFIDGETREALIQQDPKSAEIIKPLLRGRDIQAWMPDWNDQYMIFVPWHFPNHLDSDIQGSSEKSESDFKENYFAIYNHLLNHKEKLSARNKAETGIRYEWYALQRWAADYYQEFSKPKIMYPNMTKYLPFIYDEEGYFGNDKTFMITSQDDGFSLKFLIAILNSNLAKFWIRRNCPELGDDRREIRKVYFENFCIPEGANQQVFIEMTDLQMKNVKALHQKRHRFIHRLQESLGIQKVTSALERFDEVDFKTLLAELKKQKISLTLIQKDEWEDYFNQYKTDCNALSAQIAATDKQIDQMVYQLYGLTEDEIKVVEGE